MVLDDDVERRFRQKLGRKGFRKGDISKVIEELIRKYLEVR